MIRIVFKNGLRLRETLARSDREVVEEAKFDWSIIQGTRLRGESIPDYIARSNELWVSTGISPDPAMYEIEDSLWAAEHSGFGDDLHHYLIIGEEAYLEILAEGWTWEAGQEA